MGWGAVVKLFRLCLEDGSASLIDFLHMRICVFHLGISLVMVDLRGFPPGFTYSSLGLP